ncbi:branched-chain amino acid transporter permease [Moraxella nasibovis]|uniref:branched-chain amino acid transporter permease n=1 Tax=Moraxella nasibovis TaxID=2904120 RepID=UPI00240EE86C|nr:branched-chain amino acid transporter permease [Moraxella nasibovis]WFF39490.1 branched-chain amino acid transporter permease [Moraxella nasibovis]
MTIIEQLITILTAIIAVQFCRHIAFIAFPAHKPIPKFVQYLGKALPAAVFGLLVVYCYKNVHLLEGHHGLPEFIAGLVVIVLHAWRRNMFLSIGVGTCLYMFLVQKFFV